MKMYKDGVCCNADKNQKEAMLAAGWSTTPEEQKTNVFVCNKCEAKHEGDEPPAVCGVDDCKSKKFTLLEE